MNAAFQQRWQRAEQLSRAKRWKDAAPLHRSLTVESPGFVPAWLELSLAEDMLGHYRAARTALEQAIRHARDIPPLAGMAIARRLRRFDMMDVLLEWIQQNRFDRALPAPMLVELATYFSTGGAFDLPKEWVQRALALQPGYAPAHHAQGLLQMFAGDDHAAAESFLHAIRLDPDLAASYSVLAKVQPATAGANRVAALRARLAGNAHDALKMHYGYALHTELHDLGDHDEAWSALREGQRAQRRVRPYDLATDLATFKRLEQLCTREFIAAGQAFDDPITPIFIVGLHRSGTTLTERLLTGHPDVADGGETTTFPAQLRWAADYFGEGPISPPIVERAAGFDYPAIGRGFLDAMRWRARDKRYLTEKYNPNFAVVGLIARALPQARVLDVRRDAADTCFSNLRQLFAGGVGYADDPLEMADFYKGYHDLMTQIASVASDQVLTVHYQQLVDAPEATAGEIARHCGFDFDPAMLDLGRADGMVATASATQVRKGILRDRGRLWANYQPQLQPMLDRLATHGLL
jgi:tetratricopeptide (TPR) repeat protein